MAKVALIGAGSIIWSKMEDIINRGGGILNIQLYQSDKSGEFTDDDVRVLIHPR